MALYGAMDIVLGIRLHALVFAALQAVPHVVLSMILRWPASWILSGSRWADRWNAWMEIMWLSSWPICGSSGGKPRQI